MNTKDDKDREKKADKALLARLTKASQRRSERASYINEAYEFGMLDDRVRVDSGPGSNDTAEAIKEDVFDSTLAELLSDFADNQVDYYVPDYRPWVKIKASNQADFNTTTEEVELAEAIKVHQDLLYELIRETNFYEAAREAFTEMAISLGAVAIPSRRSTKPVRALPVYMNNLLVDLDSFGQFDGRWYEETLTKEEIKAEFPKEVLEKLEECHPAFKTARDNHKYKVIQGNHRNKSAEGMQYYEDIVIANKVVRRELLPAGRQPMVHPLRWVMACKTPWALGPVKKTLPLARTLDELAYNNLVSLGYISRPPVSYENDSQQNFENGIHPGGAYPRARGSVAPAPLQMTSPGAEYFDRQQLREEASRLMYADTPEQKGKTPPTTTQWLDQKASHIRRQGKRLVTSEFVMAAIVRLSEVFTDRGDLPKLKLSSKAVDIEFISPMSKTSDAEEVSAGMQLAGQSVQTFGESALSVINAEATIRNWKRGIGDETLEIVSPDQQPELLQKMLGEGRNLINDGR